MKIKITRARLSFPALWTPKAFKPGDEEKFKATFLIPKNDNLIKVIEAAFLAKATEKWGKKAEGIIASIRGNPNKFCWQDGDTKEWDGYEGCMALTAKSSTRPLVLDSNKSLLTERDGKPFAGCFVAGSVEVFIYTEGGNGMSCGLKGIQYIGKGDAFGGGAPASPDDFDDLGVEPEGEEKEEEEEEEESLA